VGILRNLFFGPAANLATSGLLSWYSPQDSIQSLFVADALGAVPENVPLTRDGALRIPAVKRAHDIICSVIADMPWFQADENGRTSDQPKWLTTTSTGIPPRDLRWAVASDLFMGGWAVIGFQRNGAEIVDALHIPAGMWTIKDGALEVSTKIDARYRQLVVPIRLGYGSNGMLVDAGDDIKDAATIRSAYRDRIENPIALTMLTVAAEQWAGWSREEREEFRQMFMVARSAKGGATGMKPDWVTVDTTAGQLPTDLFESGRNGNRLDLANHAGLPASMLEAVRQGGSGGGTEMRYTGVQNGAQRNEVWDFGVAKYASAITGRLSLDDVCPSGLSIRVDSSAFLTAPNPPDQLTSED